MLPLSSWRRSDETLKLKSGIHKGGKAPDVTFWGGLLGFSSTCLPDLDLRPYLHASQPPNEADVSVCCSLVTLGHKCSDERERLFIQNKTQIDFTAKDVIYSESHH